MRCGIWRTCWQRGSPRKPWNFSTGCCAKAKPAPALLGALAWTYRKLLEAQELPAGTPEWQASEPPQNASRMRRKGQCEQSRKFPKTQLTNGLAALYEADSRLKSGGTNQRAVMEFLVTQLASPYTRAAMTEPQNSSVAQPLLAVWFLPSLLEGIVRACGLQNHTAKSGCATQPHAFAAALSPFTATLNRDL